MVDNLLGALGYQGSFADKLKKAGPRFQNLDALWSAHKLRNRIAHEVGIHVQPKEAERALRAFEGALGCFVKM